ncbi:MAG: hypothetical protein KME47_09925 [Nodosilinea sp. WJT8-NPBG4]|jgi:hypothetical protein|nr:hypothetical protein [Nodosilinea sp. WJT8-NPBG4]
MDTYIVRYNATPLGDSYYIVKGNASSWAKSGNPITNPESVKHVASSEKEPVTHLLTDVVVKSEMPLGSVVSGVAPVEIISFTAKENCGVAYVIEVIKKSLTPHQKELFSTLNWEFQKDSSMDSNQFASKVMQLGK